MKYIFCEIKTGDLWIDELDANDQEYFNKRQEGGMMETRLFIVSGPYTEIEARAKIEEIESM